MARELIVRHFRQIVVWPLQLMPLRPGQQVQRHWEALEAIKVDNPWREVDDEFGADPADFHERHYKEFVTFLPYVQRFLFGSRAGQEVSVGDGEASMHVYRRDDVAKVRITYEPGEEPVTFDVAHVDLYFFLDADIAILAFEMHANDIPIERAQDTLFRFGRAYPAYWEQNGQGGNCPHAVEWLAHDGEVLAVSDFAARSKYLAFVARYRAPCLANHWEFLLQPLALEYPGQSAALRYRQLEYYRMPFMAYLAVDDPAELTRADFVRLALVTRPGDANSPPYSQRTLANFEQDYCDDRFWGRTGDHVSWDTRIIVTGQTLSIVGRHSDTFFSGAVTGLLGQFRHQYFLLFLIAHFHKSALVSMSDELAVAMNRLIVGDTQSVRGFKRTIRQMMEVFLRFQHRYWFHEVSSQAIARSVFSRLSKHLGNEDLLEEVRIEVTDMNNYLDSDSNRRQANTILRLTVVTIVGLIGTVATGILGMNLFAEADRPIAERVIVFVLSLAATTAFTVWSVVVSKRLANVLDTLSDQRIHWRHKLGAVRKTWRDPP
ncbi:MAG TPA: CorA family divalent cation transporter [Steroidobacteraceae bacterium]|nr:CorA family divalent cation transporter [Steroidobacteraceae bacterium]